MTIQERVDLYKDIYKGSGAIKAVQAIVDKGILKKDGWEAMELIRELDTKLAELYKVRIPVITVWVRDSHYVTQTEEIYLTDPRLEDFLHQFRHHLQNVERRYERRGITAEGATDPQVWKIPYEDCVSKMYGEDDAVAWSRFLIESITQ